MERKDSPLVPQVASSAPPDASRSALNGLYDSDARNIHADKGTVIQTHTQRGGDKDPVLASGGREANDDHVRESGSKRQT